MVATLGHPANMLAVGLVLCGFGLLAVSVAVITVFSLRFVRALDKLEPSPRAVAHVRAAALENRADRMIADGLHGNTLVGAEFICEKAKQLRDEASAIRETADGAVQEEE